MQGGTWEVPPPSSEVPPPSPGVPHRTVLTRRGIVLMGCRIKTVRRSVRLTHRRTETVGPPVSSTRWPIHSMGSRVDSTGHRVKTMRCPLPDAGAVLHCRLPAGGGIPPGSGEAGWPYPLTGFKTLSGERDCIMACTGNPGCLPDNQTGGAGFTAVNDPDGVNPGGVP